MTGNTMTPRADLPAAVVEKLVKEIERILADVRARMGDSIRDTTPYARAALAVAEAAIRARDAAQGGEDVAALQAAIDQAASGHWTDLIQPGVLKAMASDQIEAALDAFHGSRHWREIDAEGWLRASMGRALAAAYRARAEGFTGPMQPRHAYGLLIELAAEVGRNVKEGG